MIARAKKKNIRDLVVFILSRTRHRDLIEEIRTAGARVMVRSHGDWAETESLVLRCETGTRRILHAELCLEED